jgi:hypothetical protein
MVILGLAIPSEVLDKLALKFEVLLPRLNERQRRLLLAAETGLLGMAGSGRSPGWPG